MGNRSWVIGKQPATLSVLLPYYMDRRFQVSRKEDRFKFQEEETVSSFRFQVKDSCGFRVARCESETREGQFPYVRAGLTV